MKIAIFSINPVFPDVVTGGASKHLFHIARHLAEKEHAVEIYCAQAGNDTKPFDWAEQVRVLPILPFDIPFPQPYNLSGPDLALITERLRNGLRDADRFYIHDGEWLIPDVYHDIPTIASFRDNVYPESILGSFITKADDILCVSPYSALVIKNTAGRFFPDLNLRIHQVNNGIDFNTFRRHDPSALAQELGLDPDGELILLHPHRPEPGKGLLETLRVAERLVHKEGLANLSVLVPEWIEGMSSSGEDAFRQEMLQLMRRLGVQDHFKFIPWLPNDRMPELYSLGALTLCLGNIVEAFGNVAYESMACGTPSIVAKVGVHRTLMPDHLLPKVHYGDTDAAVNLALEFLQNGSTVSQEAADYLHTQMDFNQQVEAYTEIIENCEKKGPLRFDFQASDRSTEYHLAPWCYFHDDMVYHDFRGSFEPAAGLSRLLNQQGFLTQDQALRAGVSREEWETWLERTLIVPQLNH